MEIQLTKEIIGLASAITVANSINQPKAKKLKEIFADKVLKLIR